MPKDMQQETSEQEVSREEVPQEQKKEVYVPRPAWQVWSARIALVVFILFLIMYYINILRGNG